MHDKDTWFSVKQIADQVYLIDDHGESNMYLIIGSEKALLIDTGWGIGDLRSLVSDLTELPLMVVNTHGHSDHVCGGYLFPEIHISEVEAASLQECFAPEDRKWALDNVIKGPFPKTFQSEKWIHAKVEKLTLIHDGHIFELGDRKVEVVSIPGHSPGGIGLLDHKEKLFFSGDSILEGDIWMHLDDSLSLEEYLESLHRIHARAHEIEKILPAHVHTPLEYGIVDELMKGIQDILTGKREGIPYMTFVGEGLLCRFDTCGVIYKKA